MCKLTEVKRTTADNKNLSKQISFCDIFKWRKLNLSSSGVCSKDTLRVSRVRHSFDSNMLLSQKFDLIKTIDDGDEVPDLSEESDEEEEVPEKSTRCNYLFVI